MVKRKKAIYKSRATLLEQRTMLWLPTMHETNRRPGSHTGWALGYIFGMYVDMESDSGRTAANERQRTEWRPI